MTCPLVHGTPFGFCSFSAAVRALLLLSACTACASSESTHPPAGSANIVDQVATCSAPHASNPHPATLAGSISQAKPTFELVCQGSDSNAVPAGLTKVCQKTAPTLLTPTVRTTTLSVCSSGTDQCDLSTLLYPGAKAAWKAVTVTGGDSGTTGDTKYQLTIPKDEFPVLETKFLVGCMKNNEVNSSCQVNITVSPRASEVSAGNVVICAYGRESNSTPMAVTLTSQQNSFTLRCGSEGTQSPTDRQEYCSGTSVDDCNPKKLTSLIPKATASWWTATDSQNGVMKLTIPKDAFPSADAVFLVGCKKPEKAPGTETSSCNVRITVRAPAGSGFRTEAPSLGVILAGVLVVSAGLIA